MTHLAKSSRSTELVGSQIPRIWTPRRSDAPSRSAAMIRLAAIAGIDLDEWQINAVDVGLEYDAVSGKWTRRLVVILVARQNGKTVILESRILFGLYAVPDERLILHTAQDRAVPRELFESMVERIESTPALSRQVRKIRETNGQERIRLKDGSTYRIVAPRAKAFRSWSADLLVFDEAREQHDSDLWGASYPTQRSRPNPQAWIVSNAGDPSSVVLNGLRDRGRAAADRPGSDPTIAYLEWSAEPQAELGDRAAWAAANPSLGFRIDGGAIVDEMLSLSENSFRTEVLCQWVATKTDPAIDQGRWADCAGEPDPVVAGLPRPVAAIHINGDRTYGALAIAAERDGRLVLDLADEWNDPDGVDLLAITRDVVAWMKSLKIRDLAYDRAAAATIAAQVTRRGWNAHRIDTVEYVIASQNLSDAVNTGWLLHRSNPSLNTQVEAAGRRVRADETWHISPAASSGEIAGVLAASFAVSLAYRPPQTTSIA